LGHRVLRAEGEDLTVAETRQNYHKLPGRRRGFVFSASLWAGADHLLSVKSARFQEQYKRFYFRDIQAIVVTKSPRWVVSTPVFAGAALLLTAVLIVRMLLPVLTDWLWLLLAALTGAWIYVSAAQSCTCRMYTAVSREDLPSIYRMWTARKALAELEQRIAQVQGVFPENWAEAVDLRTLGPAAPANSAAAAGRRAATAHSRTWVSDIFLASLFADAVVTMLQINSRSPWLANLSMPLTVVQMASAIGIFVQRYRGELRIGMQRLAIAALLFIGGITYAQMIGDTMDAAMAGRRGPVVVRARPRSGIVRPIYSGGAALLAIAGFVLSFKPE
jgi:hypothetical protein